MTQQPGGGRGAVDLSGLSPAPTGPATSAAYAVDLDEQNFQDVLDTSMQAPVILSFFSSSSPESHALTDDLQTLSNEFEGRFLLGRVDIDAQPRIAQAMQIPSVPLVVLIAQGRPMPLFQDPAPMDALRATLTQLFQQLTASGLTGRHKPRAAVDAETGEEVADPRYAAADDALQRGDIDAAVVEYQKLIDANPADHEAARGLAMAKLLQRTQGVDLNGAREKAAQNPDDVEAQIMCADLDLLGGHVEDSFARLVRYVATHFDDSRDQARLHAIALFAAVGDEDPRVQRARRDLASALF